MIDNHLVIMAGGIGSRFFPMSTPECPKQFIDVLGCGRTLLQLSADRFATLCDPSHIWVVTSLQYFNIVVKQLPQIPKGHILLEPCMRNTAPCIAYVAWKIKKEFPHANIMVTPSDHIVTNVEEFKRIMQEATAFTNKTDAIVTIGIKPSHPETGYGYIKATSACKEHIMPVEEFKEKPNLTTAQQYINTGGYYWNAGIFVWNVQTLEKAFRLYQSDIAHIFDQITPFLYTPQEQNMINNLFPTCPAISIDYGIMEKSNNIYVLPADFGWSDLGTWGSLHKQLPQDHAQNAIVGNKTCLIESSGCIVHLPRDKKAIIQGLDNYIIAEKNGILLICKIEDEQRIKEFSNQLKNNSLK